MGFKAPSTYKPKKPDLCLGCALYEDKSVEFSGEPNPDILFVGAFPIPEDVRKGPFYSPAGVLVRNIVKEMREQIAVNAQPKVAYAYAIKCSPISTKYKVTKDIIDQCNPNLLMAVDRFKPKLIVPLGADALKSLGIATILRELRGTFKEHTLGGVGKKVTILPTLHPVSVVKESGKLEVFKGDIKKALDFVTKEVSPEQLNAVTPTSYDEVLKEIELLKEASQKHYEEKGAALPIGLDTETTSLTPYKKGERIIAISWAYKKGEGVCIPFEHRAVPFTKKQLANIKHQLGLVLSNKNTFRILHNAKFDYQWIKYKESISINDVDWDTMLVEHVLEEDKKGEYSLKVLTSDYFPERAKYEAELKQCLKDKKEEYMSAYRALMKEYLAAKSEFYVDYWINLGTVERLRLLGKWSDAGVLEASEGAAILTPKYKKGSKEVVLKSYKTLVARTLRKVPEEDIPEFTGMEMPDIANTEVTFEDIDYQVMAKYAAMDALNTRDIAIKQQERLRAENAIIRNIEKKYKAKLSTPSIFWQINNLTNPMSTLISEMEYFGVKIDRDLIREYIEVIDKELKTIEKGLYDEAGYEFNPRSSAALGKLLYKDLGLPILKRSELTGEPSTDAETLKSLSEQCNSSILEALLHFRKLEKCKNTYLKNWLKMSEEDGKLHARFNINGTASYRLSSSSPNL